MALGHQMPALCSLQLEQSPMPADAAGSPLGGTGRIENAVVTWQGPPLSPEVPHEERPQLRAGPWRSWKPALPSAVTLPPLEPGTWWGQELAVWGRRSPDPGVCGAGPRAEGPGRKPRAPHTFDPCCGAPPHCPCLRLMTQDFRDLGCWKGNCIMPIKKEEKISIRKFWCGENDFETRFLNPV